VSGKGQKNGKRKGDKQQSPVKATIVNVSFQKRTPAPSSPTPAPTAHSTTTSPAALPAGDWLQPALDISKGTLQQQRAAFALHHVQALAAQADGKRQKQLNSYAAKMPFMIHANGLGQTAAFYRAKGEKDPHCDLYRLLGAWLTRAAQPFAGKTDLLDGITSTDLHTYMAAQAEAMLLLSWVKQFAAAFLESE